MRGVKGGKLAPTVREELAMVVAASFGDGHKCDSGLNEASAEQAGPADRGRSIALLEGRIFASQVEGPCAAGPVIISYASAVK